MAKDSFAEIWDAADKEIAEIYEPGTFDFLEKKIPKLYRKIQFAEDRINLHWGEDLSFFKGSIGLWKDLMRQAIQEFYNDRIQTTGAKIAASLPKAERAHDRGKAATHAPEIKKEPPAKRPANIFEQIREGK